MKFTKTLVSSIVILLFIFSSFAFAQNTGFGIISGTVKSEADSTAISDAWVLAIDVQNPLQLLKHHVQTDSTGFYQFDSLTIGQYYVYARADSFIAELYDDAANLLSGNPVAVTANQSTENIDFYLALGGIISGVVQDSSGTGIPNVIVVATTYSFYPTPGWNDSLFSPYYQFARTDNDGKYSINTLGEGQYRVTAKLNDVFPPLIQYWENTYDYDSATPIDVTAGEKIGNINFEFEYLAPSGRIAGLITDVAGNPLADIWVVAYNPMPLDSIFRHFVGFPNMARTDENGEYEIAGLWAGNYYVSATCWDWFNYQMKWYDNVTSYDEATAVEVFSDSTTSEIDFIFNNENPIGSISGKIVSDVDGTPVPNAYVEAMLIDSTFFGPTVRPRPAMSAYSDENGEYSIDMVLEGKYVLLVHKDSYTEFYDGVQALDEATHIIVTAGTATENIDFSIPPFPETGSRLSGLVTDDSTNAPIAGTLIAVYPVGDTTRTGYFSGNFTLFDYYATISDSNGNFIVGGLPAGEYIVSCWASKYIVEFYNEKNDPWSADRVTVDGAEYKTDINFTLKAGLGFQFDMPGNDFSFGTISGQVKTSDGTPVASAYVSAVDQNTNTLATERTGPDGFYTLDGLPTGEYYVKVDRMPFDSEYYGNTTEIGDAELVAVGESGNWDASDTNFELTAQTTAIGEKTSSNKATPAKFSLAQNYPNPFNPTTMISYSLPNACHVTLNVYNIRGELVQALVNNFQQAQSYNVMWNGKNSLGQKVAAGVYIYQIRAENFNQTKRLILLK